MNNDEIQDLIAIHPEDVEAFFKDIGLLQEIKNQNILCCGCQEPITFQNLFAGIKQNNQYFFCCDKSDCITHLKGRQFQ